MVKVIVDRYKMLIEEDLDVNEWSAYNSIELYSVFECFATFMNLLQFTIHNQLMLSIVINLEEYS